MLKKNKLLFTKYKTLGCNYHYQQINKLNPLMFNAFVVARYQLHIKLILSQIKNFNEINHFKILDVGCGDGVLLYLLKQKLKDYNHVLYGLDSSREALKIAKQKIPAGHFLKGEACNLRFPDNSFDIVVSSDVIEHVKNQDKMLREIKRVVKKNGVVIIGTPIRITETPWDKSHFHEFFPNEFKEITEEYFRFVKLIKSHPLLTYLLYKHSFIFLGKKIFLFYLLINFLVIILNINPFLKIQEDREGFFAYMFLVGKNKK